jgi:hypothetical protein
MRALASLLLLLVLSSPASGQVSFDPPELTPAADSCSRSVGFIGRPILDLESVIVNAGHATRTALDRRAVPGLLASNPDVIFVMRSGADAARLNSLDLDAWVRAGGLLITDFSATQLLYESGPLHYLDGLLVDDFWIPSGTACGGNAIRVEAPGHPFADGLPDAWPCSGDPMGTFQVFAGVDPELCVLLSVIGSDRDGDGRDDPVLGTKPVGLGTVAPFFSDIANFQPLQEPRVCPSGPASARCNRSLLDERVVLNVICHGDEPARCDGCGDCDALEETLALAEIDNEGVRNALESRVRQACGQLRRGRLLTAGNALCALTHQVDAQDGKHLSSASAEELRTCIAELSEAAGLRPALPLIGCGGRPALSNPGGLPRR